MFDKLEDLLIRYEEVMGELQEPTTSAVLLKNFMGSPHPVTENKTEFLPCNIQRQELFS